MTADGRCRYFHRRTGLEEVVGFQREAGIFDRHDRKILRLADMCVAKTMPENDVLVGNAAPLADVDRQAALATVLVGIVATGKPLFRCVACHPDMLGGKTGAFV